MNKVNLMIAAAALCLSAQANAGVITTYTSFGSFPGTDTIDWGQLGPSFTTVGAPFTVTSADGLVITVTQPGDATFERRDEGNGWAGTFNGGEHLLWNQDATAEMDFSSAPISGFGTAIQTDLYGGYSATLSAYDGATLLGSVIVSGNSSNAEDGSAPFAGIMDTDAEITKIVITTNNGGFAIDAASLIPAAPEPATIGLLGAGMAGIGFVRRRKKV